MAEKDSRERSAADRQNQRGRHATAAARAVVGKFDDGCAITLLLFFFANVERCFPIVIELMDEILEFRFGAERIYSDNPEKEVQRRFH